VTPPQRPTSWTSLVEVLRSRAETQPDRIAFTWLGGDPEGDVDLTYRELAQRAQAVAALLLTAGLPGERALLLCPPGFDFIAALCGCLAAGWLAVPAYPPPLNQRLDRVRAIADDAQPRVAITTRATLARIVPRLSGEPSLARLRWLTADDAGTSPAMVDGPPPDPDQPAILQYTSGSTAAPRGVVLTHANLVHNTRQIQRRFAASAASRGVIWLPPYHDMGLIGGIFEGLWAGFPIALMAPATFLQRPRRWLEAIGRTRATISGGPNFAYDLCVDRIAPADRAGLELATWEVAFNGAEPVRARTLQRFAEAFAPVGFRRAAFYPCYGLAEGTLMVTGGRADHPPVLRPLPDDQVAVGVGTSVDAQVVRIVDPSTGRSCAPEVPGEIWVSGPSVAAGYWQQPARTAETFDAYTATGEGPFLRTGDLGLLDRAGELFVTGRLKALLMVGGRKVPAEDIEASLQRESRGLCIALAADLGGAERVVIVAEASPRLSSAEHVALASTLRACVASRHQLPVAAVALTRPRGIPRTSSGKVQRATCRTAFERGELPTVYLWRAPWANAANASC
jgi:acyl-CoA synthetase (AMP-forming)/AMP-acid ligase II